MVKLYRRNFIFSLGISIVFGSLSLIRNSMAKKDDDEEEILYDKKIKEFDYTHSIKDLSGILKKKQQEHHKIAKMYWQEEAICETCDHYNAISKIKHYGLCKVMKKHGGERSFVYEKGWCTKWKIDHMFRLEGR